MTEAPAPRRSQRRWLRYGVMLAAAAPIALALALSKAGGGGAKIALTEADRGMLADGLRLLRPSYSGRTKDGEPFQISADWALPDAPDPTKVTLANVAGTATLKDGRSLTLSAPRGAAWPKASRYALLGGVDIRSDDGYSVHTSGATLEGDSLMLRSDGPVALAGPGGALSADHLEAFRNPDNGWIAIFRGNVKVSFDPAAPRP